MSKKNKNFFETEEVEETKEEVVEDSAEELKIEEDSDIEINKNEEIDESKDENSRFENYEDDFVEEETKVKVGTVNCSKLNVRELPSLTSKILTVLNMNDTVTIVNDKNPLFYQVLIKKAIDEIHNGNDIGFVMKEFINL